MSGEWSAVRLWPSRTWAVAALGAIVTALLVAVPTAVIPNPVFGRSVAVTWWSYPVVVVTAMLGGLLIATYVRTGTVAADGDEPDADRATRLGMAGAVVSFFAVGCPVCNKLVLLALGASGALAWFAPVQPYLAVVSMVLMAVSLRIRLRGQVSCTTVSSDTP